MKPTNTSVTVWREYEASTREVFGLTKNEVIEEQSFDGETIKIMTTQEKRV
jgi:hypothetical protein